jgi:hypothetical protein
MTSEGANAPTDLPLIEGLAHPSFDAPNRATITLNLHLTEDTP